MHKIIYEKLPKIIVNGAEVEYVDEMRDLGYFLNRTITSKSHTSEVQQKVYATLSSIHPLENVLPKEIRLQLVKSLILPIFDYMDIVYHDFGVHGTRGDSDKLEKMLDICIRYILNISRSGHITQHRESLQILKLYDRRVQHVASFINKIINNNSPKYLKSLIQLNEGNACKKQINRAITQK